MANEKPALVPIEDLIKKHNVKPWAAAGLMAEKKWAAGRQLTEKEFSDALAGWLKAPMSGPAAAKGGK